MSRNEAKQRTRQRLLDAALAVLDEEGEQALTTTRVTRRAGIAQSSFYVHFSGMDDLLCSLVDQLWGRRRAAAHQAGAAALGRASAQAAMREYFRATVTGLVEHPAVLRLVLRSRLDPASPLGDHTRALLDATRRGLVTALVAGGAPDRTSEERRKLEMRADGMIAFVDALALGHLDGRYPDVEEVLDLLVQLARTASRRRRPRRAPPSPSGRDRP